jgi:eukaryotic-like serine/threonine-protein kinase
MGLLMQPKVAPISSLAILAAATGLLVMSCTGLRLGRSLYPREDDWPAFGRNASHSNAVTHQIGLPLSPAWQCDIAAGIANGAPILVDSMILGGTMRGDLYAIRLSDGKRLGWIGLGDAVHGSPVFDGNAVIVPLSNSRESLVSFDLPNGTIRWKQSYGDIESSILLNDKRLFFGTTGGKFLCVESATGSRIWSFSLPSNSQMSGIRSSPAARKSTVVFGADDGVVYALDIKDGSVKWTYGAGAPIAAPPAIDSPGVVIGTIGGKVIALDLETGRLRWSVDVGSPVYAHALITPAVITIATTGGDLFGFSPSTGGRLWKTEIGSPMVAGPAAAGGTLFIGTLKREVLAVGIADGAILWKGTTEGRIKTSPVIGYGMVFFATDNQDILAYREAP